MLRRSIQSLRAVNPDVCIYVTVFGDTVDLISDLSSEYRCNIIELRDYKTELEMVCGDRAAVFQHYPVLHKWLALVRLSGCEHDSLLYVDNDTVFFDNPLELFRKYRSCDWYAREEPYSSRSHLGYDARYLNEAALAELAKDPAAIVPPMNLGVILMNCGMWAKLVQALPWLFDTMWGFLSWLCRWKTNVIAAEPRISALIDAFERSQLVPGKRIPYPSSNFWILEQVAMLLALGKLQGFRTGILSSDHAIQGIEFEGYTAADFVEQQHPALCHYYSKNRVRFFRWYENVLLTLGERVH